MPVPDLKWLSYEVPADVGDSRRREHGALVAGDEPTIGVHIPDLRRYRRPCDKAQALLQTAAEVEHALLVQYLYAAFSLKGKGEQLTADQESLVDTWRGEIRHIAKQEMGHLITAQNMLLALSKPPNLKREGFPSIKDLYPFKFHLEPLSQCSLAQPLRTARSGVLHRGRGVSRWIGQLVLGSAPLQGSECRLPAVGTADLAPRRQRNR